MGGKGVERETEREGGTERESDLATPSGGVRSDGARKNLVRSTSFHRVRVVVNIPCSAE